MPDTDDGQNIALELDQNEQGEEDGTESVRERRARALQRQRDERLASVTGLTPEEAEVRREAELQQARDKGLELTRQDERTLEERRRREETLDASAAATRDVRAEEAKEAYRLAHIAELDSDRHRELAATARRQSVNDQARGGHKLDEAAVRPDEPGAAGLAASGRRDQRAAGGEDRVAAEHEIIAGEHDDEARERRVEGRRAQEQPPAVDAVRTRPWKPPQARTHKSEQVKKLHQLTRSKPDPLEPDLGLD
jgi:hypothetical protein